VRQSARNHSSVLLLQELMRVDRHRELVEAFIRADIRSLCDAGPGAILPDQSGFYCMIRRTNSTIPEEFLSESRLRTGLQADLCTLIGTLTPAMIAVREMVPAALIPFSHRVRPKVLRETSALKLMPWHPGRLLCRYWVASQFNPKQIFLPWHHGPRSPLRDCLSEFDRTAFYPWAALFINGAPALRDRLN
jgi:hypothetical protein